MYFFLIRMSVCHMSCVFVSVCHRKKTVPGGLDTSDWRGYHWYWHTSRCFWVFVVLMIFCVLKFVQVLGSLQTSLMRIIGELAGRGSVNVAVSISDRWQLSHNMWHVTPDMWYVNIFIFLISFIGCHFLSVPVHFGMGATIRTHQEVQCAPMQKNIFIIISISWPLFFSLYLLIKFFSQE